MTSKARLGWWGIRTSEKWFGAKLCRALKRDIKLSKLTATLGGSQWSVWSAGLKTGEERVGDSNTKCITAKVKSRHERKQERLLGVWTTERPRILSGLHLNCTNWLQLLKINLRGCASVWKLSVLRNVEQIVMISSLYGSLWSASMPSGWPSQTPEPDDPAGVSLFAPEAQFKPKGFLSKAWSYGRSCRWKSGQQNWRPLKKKTFSK